MKQKSRRFRRLTHGLKLITCLLVLSMLTTACDIKTAAEIIRDDIVPQLVGPVDQWRRAWEEGIDKLVQLGEDFPAEAREQVDLAFERAIAAAGAEFRCETDFIRDRLSQELQRIAATLPNVAPPPYYPHVCQILPQEVVKLDSHLVPENIGWITFVGYDLDDPSVKVLMENKDGATTELTHCCLDTPTHYNLTVDFDEVKFTRENRRIRIVWTGDSPTRTVAIHVPTPSPEPPPAFLDSYWSEEFSEEPPSYAQCLSGYAIQGLKCTRNDYCDNMRLYCSPYIRGPEPTDPDENLTWISDPSRNNEPRWVSRYESTDTYVTEEGFLAGLACRGDYCDDIRPLVLTSPRLENRGQCRKLDWISEESTRNTATCPNGMFVAGLTCQGSECDRIYVHCCLAEYD